MTKLLSLGLAAAAVVAAAPATAQVSGIAVADPQAAIANSAAWQAARTQIQTTYKAQIAQADARRQALTAELQPLVTAFQAAQRQPGASDATLAPQYQAIQTRENAANQELVRLSDPFQRAQSYALEQLQGKLPDAINAAVKARGVTLLLRPEAVFYGPTADITPAVTTELNRISPTIGITPPPGWQPNQQGGAAGGAAAPASSPTAPAAGGRRNSGGR